MLSLDAAPYPTVGVFQKRALQGGWVDSTVVEFQGVYAMKTVTDKVQLRGSISAGAYTPGSPIAALPAGFRPRKGHPNSPSRL